MAGARPEEAAFAPPASPRRPAWRRPWVRAIAWQALALALVAALVIGAAMNVAGNLPRSGLTVGWDFLRFPARFDIDDNVLGATGADPVWMAFLAGIANTVTVSIVAIFLCTILAFCVALARLSRNWLLSNAALVYIETVRNVPLLLQLLFWYGFSAAMPLPRGAYEPIAGVFVTNRGIYFPGLVMERAHYWALAAFLVALAVLIVAIAHARRRRMETGRGSRLVWAALGLLLAAPAMVLVAAGASFQIETPVLRGFNFVGGRTLSPEFVAVVIGLAVYQSGFTAETFRSGILGVRRGQLEAARSLGLRPAATMRHVVAPQALRIIIPPLTSQYLSLTKSSSLGVVIGYPELMRVTTAVIAETSRAIECVVIIMAVYLTLSLLTAALMNHYDRRIAFKER